MLAKKQLLISRVLAVVLVLISSAAAAQVGETIAASKAIEGIWRIGGLSGALCLVLTASIGFNYWLVQQLLTVIVKVTRQQAEIVAGIQAIAVELRNRPCIKVDGCHRTPDPFANVIASSATPVKGYRND